MKRKDKPANSIAVGYIRVSLEDQAREGHSLAAQEAYIRAYATMRNLTLREVIVDAGVSGGVPVEDRPGGKRLLQAVADGCGTVVAWKLDRLFRDAADCLRVTAAWDAAGAAMHLVDMGGQAVDTRSAMGRFFLTVMAAAAELERGQIRERVTTTLAHRKAEGKRTGSVPLGKSVAADGKTLVDNAAESEAIAFARRLHDEKLPLRVICGRLTEAGFRPRSGGEWFPQQIKRMVG